MYDAQVVWDPDDEPDGNVQHIAENDLTVDEVENVLLNPENDVLISRTSGRPLTLGWTFTGRHIAVIWETVCDNPKMIKVRTAYEVEPRRRKP
ncbi:MAG: DUF4258 domain-containing protein [Isosphaerales bacterium]